MADESTEKTPLQRSREMISQLKEMEHYSRANVEKLSAFWLVLDEELKQQAIADGMNELLSAQSAFEDRITALIEEFEMACNRVEQAG